MRILEKDLTLIVLYSYRNINVSYFEENGKFLGVYTVAANLNCNSGISYTNLGDCKRETFKETEILVKACLKGGALVKSDIGDFFRCANYAMKKGQQSLLF